MWKRLAAIAALAIAPCAIAQVPSSPAPLTLDEAVSRVARTHPDLRLPALQRAAAQARHDGAGFTPPLVFGVDVENALGSGDSRGFAASEVTVSLAGVLGSSRLLTKRPSLPSFTGMSKLLRLWMVR